MNYWSDLALRTLAAEFPSFEFAQAFVVFRLEKSVVKDAELDIYYQRLASVLKMEDFGELKSQTERFRPSALRILKDTGCTVAEAWKRAIDNRNAQRSRYRKENPVALLLKALLRFRSIGISTMGIEGLFGRFKSYFKSAQKRAGSNTERDHAYLKLDRPDEQHEIDKIIPRAQEVWKRCYGVVRSFPKIARSDSGTKKLSKIDAGSGASSILAKRRASLQKTMSAPSSSLAFDYEINEPSEEFHQMAQFQADKERKRKLDAVLSGQLLASEVDDDLAREAGSWKQEKSKKQSEALSRWRAQYNRGCETLDFTGMKYYVEKSVHHDVDAVCRDKWQMSRVPERIAADLFVVQSPAKMEARIETVARIKGCYVVTPDVFAGAVGSVIKFKSKLKTAKRIWFSPEFKKCRRHKTNYYIALLILESITTAYCLLLILGNRYYCLLLILTM